MRPRSFRTCWRRSWQGIGDSGREAQARLRVLRSGGLRPDALVRAQARHLLAIGSDTVRPGFLPRRSYVAPSPQSRNPTKRPEVELNPRPVYDSDHQAISILRLTSAFFYTTHRFQLVGITAATIPVQLRAEPSLPTSKPPSCSPQTACHIKCRGGDITLTHPSTELITTVLRELMRGPV